MTRLKLATPAPKSSALSAAVERALRAASGRAAATLADHGNERARAELDALAGTVTAMIRGEAPEVHASTEELVHAFRAAFVAELADARARRISGTELVAVFAALEALARGATHRTGGAEAREALAGSAALDGMLEIAHDMRSPLAAILLLVEPIRRGQKGPVTPVQERQLGLIYGAALSLSTLANDIIEAAHGSARAEFAQRPFSVSATIQDTCDIVRPIAEEKQLELQRTFPVVDARMGDASAIHRVLLNLTSNALKYTERGSVAVACTELDDRRIEFSVTDTGDGIPDAALAVLSEGFRPRQGGPRFSSSGLGLAICRTLLEGMGSTLRIETARGVGTRCAFTLDLPPAPQP